MNAEQYLERIENKRLNSTPLYSKKEMIDFAEKYAKQLTLTDVVGTLCEQLKIPKTTKEQRVQLNEGYNKK